MYGVNHLKQHTMQHKLVNVFRLDGELFALPLERIDKIVRSVEIKSIQGLPEFIQGILCIHGKYMPLIDLRHHFSLPEKDISIVDRFVIISSGKMPFALVVSEVLDIQQVCEPDLLELDQFSTNTVFDAVASMNGQTVMMLNPDRLLSEIETEKLKDNLFSVHNEKMRA